jgi:hypothetical protein
MRRMRPYASSIVPSGGALTTIAGALFVLLAACADVHSDSPKRTGRPTFCLNVLPGPIFQAAIDNWNTALNREALFTEECPADAVDVDVMTDSMRIQGVDGFWSWTGEGDIDVDITQNLPPGYLQTVIEHELGHTLCSCADHSEDWRSVMYEYPAEALGESRILKSDIDRVNDAGWP